MKRLLRTIDAISEWAGRIFAVLLFAGVAVLVWEVFTRYFLNAPTVWAHGTAIRIFGAYYVIGGVFVLKYRAHIAVDVIYSRLPLRVRAIIDVVSAPVLLIFGAVLLWYGWDFALASLKIREIDVTAFNAPVYPVKLMIPIAAFLFLLQGLAKFVRDLITACTGRPYGA